MGADISKSISVDVWVLYLANTVGFTVFLKPLEEIFKPHGSTNSFFLKRMEATDTGSFYLVSAGVETDL
jgi:hypothetical protein